jgi:hypothetical protein
MKLVHKFRDYKHNHVKFYNWLNVANKERIRDACFTIANSHHAMLFMYWLTLTPMSEIWLPSDKREKIINDMKRDPIDTFFSLEKFIQHELVITYNRQLSHRV